MEESSTQNVYRKGSMRPHCSQHDPEGDDETVIVYNDTSIEQSWEFSQFSASQSQTDQSLTANAKIQNEKGKCEKESHCHNQHEEEVSALISRKRPYRSLGRRGRNFRRQTDAPIDGDRSIQYENGNHDQVDDFASLRSKIDQLSPGQKRNFPHEQQLDGNTGTEAHLKCQKYLYRDENNAENFQNLSAEATKPPPIVKKTNLSYPGAMLNDENQLTDPGNVKIPQIQNSVATISLRKIGFPTVAIQDATQGNRLSTETTLCSPPDFDFCTFDKEDDENSDGGVNNNIEMNKTSTSLSIPSHLRARHQNSHFGESGRNKLQGHDNDCDSDNIGRTNRHRRFSSTDETKFIENQKNRSRRTFSPKQIAIASTQTRKRRCPDKTGRQALTSTRLNSNTAKQLNLNQSTTQLATNVENVKSIVGLRPTHWHRGTRKLKNRHSSSTERKTMQQLAKKSALAAATRFSFNKPPIRTSKKIKSDHVRHVENSGHDSNVGNITSNLDCSPIKKKEEEEIHLEKEKSISEATKSSFSFAPSFVTTKSSALSQDSIGDDSGDDCRVVTSPINHSFASTPPFRKRRRSKAATGEWGRRLVSLRNSLSNDSVRLQNKAFARQRILLDVSDPRKRAKTCIDVTILGQYIGPWINVPEDTKVTVLGYVHCHTQRIIKNCTDKDRHFACHQQTQKPEDTKTVSKDILAWFTFTLATARRIELQQGCKLRIYNTIILPCRLPMVLDAPPTSILPPECGIEMTGRVICEKTVICTQLCERLD